ncbi:hypothetical protein [Sphingomonas psychrotolerans]|uniref:DUF998 domain-containing protein n=1 Tax=Sphingomonas psychrotolerans TaxID=1327635 RepID=A0A2K8MFN8_9SPHN|nr:hypothetical protein [Sphingomonas psychrotolerans]ATY31356.1 hypothetical protein CVN68_04635 [Sphingomonas psychrotolerans]
MPDQEAPFDVQDSPDDLLDAADKRHFQQIFNKQAVRAYLYLSFGMGVIAFSLPILLVLAGGYEGHYSISYFYHVSDTCQNILVGCLCATGLFLFLFHGLSNVENWILNLAGAAAISVAMNPMRAQQCRAGDDMLSVHAASAILFFACLAVVAVIFSKRRIKHIKDPARRRAFETAYNAAGFAMIAMPAAVAATHFLRKADVAAVAADCTHWIFWIECFGIWAFAFYWFVKTLEYRLLLRIR